MKRLYHVCGDMSDYILTVRAKSARKALKLARASNYFRASDRLAAIEISVSGPSMVVDDFPVERATFEKPKVREITGQLLYHGKPYITGEQYTRVFEGILAKRDEDKGKLK